MGIFPSLDNIPKEEIKEAAIPIGAAFSTESYFVDSFLEKIKSGELNETQICQDILLNYGKYCNYDNFNDPGTRNSFQQLWTNESFLRAFYKALSTIKKLDLYYNKSICKITYDYYINRKTDELDTISTLQINIVKFLNRKKILALNAFMHEMSAIFMVLAYLSSFNPTECVQRVTNLIVKMDYDFSIDNLISIYTILYKNSFKILFVSTMTKIFTEEELSKNENRKLVNDRINKTLLIILESMESTEIDKVLIGYSIYIHMYNQPTRFSLKNDTIKENYPRVYSRIEYLEFNKYIIP